MPNGLTALFYAAQNGHIKVIKCLKEHNAILDIPFISSVESLHAFAKKNDELVNVRMRIMINRHLNNGEKEDSIALKPYEIAWIMGHKQVLQELVKSKDKESLPLRAFPMWLIVTILLS